VADRLAGVLLVSALGKQLLDVLQGQGHGLLYLLGLTGGCAASLGF
jgi:hypothetical protein